jgi:CubicO group peptidase (beta-lactamase class C family)
MTTNQTTTLDMNELENYIIDVMKRWEVPGLSIAIVKDGKTLLAKGYGTREVGKDLPVDEHTLFAISGSTAAFTASALAILVGEGKLDWNDRMIDLLPDFKTADDMVTYHTTVVDALANRTGLPMETLSFGPHRDLSRMDILGRMKHISSDNNFRTCWGANILMNVAAGEIIPALIGQTWDDFVQGRLFDPIGMSDSITGPHLFGSNHNIAKPHETEQGQVTPVSYAESTNVGPASSIYSSAADMAHWLTFQLNDGRIGDETLISEEGINMMRTNHIVANFDFPGIAKNFINQGLGLFISDSSSGHKLYSNGGDTEGFESYHAFLPELDLGIAVMINSTKVMPQPLIAWVIDRYTDAPRKDWVNELVPFYSEGLEMMLSNLENSRQEITDPSKKPSQSIESYAGLYQHPLLGDLTVQATNGELSFALGTSYKGDLLHANHDTFFIKVKTPHLGKLKFSGPAQFRLDQTGQVASLFAVDREFHRGS